MAKNTIVLYVRMLVVMAVSFYTSRIALDALGVEDYGVYNVVAGLVVLFAFINVSMVSATQRYLNYYMGRCEAQMVDRVFSASLTLHWAIAAVVVVGGETVGLWLMYHYIKVPEGMFGPAMWTYQLSILATCAQIVRTPYHAAVIAHENMRVYAYLNILENLAKLAMAYCICLADRQRLILYAALLLVVVTIASCLYWMYCRRHYEECVYQPRLGKGLHRELLAFSGWSMLGGVANTGSTQGVNIVLNVFHGVTLNAAMGIAQQVQAAVYQLVSNFQTAFGPQLGKTFAAGESDAFKDLTVKASKYSYFLLFPVALPVYVCCDQCLHIWLTNVPPYTVAFCRLAILYVLLDALQSPLWLAVVAIGRIRTYQIITSLFICLNLPLSYITLKMGLPPFCVLFIRVCINFMLIGYRLWFLHRECNFTVWAYTRETLIPISLITVLSYVAVDICMIETRPFLQIVCCTGESLAVCLPLAFFIGLTTAERNALLVRVRAAFHKVFK